MTPGIQHEMILLNKYMTPSGERMLLMIVFALAILLVYLLWRAFYRYKASPVRIKKRVWYSGGLKMAVHIRNVRKDIIEIDTPVIEFRQPRMSKRRYKIVTPGDRDIFPLGLSPQTGYDFVVEFTRLYERTPVLRKYRRVVILINRYGKIIARKRVKLSLPG